MGPETETPPKKGTWDQADRQEVNRMTDRQVQKHYLAPTFAWANEKINWDTLPTQLETTHINSGESRITQMRGANPNGGGANLLQSASK